MLDLPPAATIVPTTILVTLPAPLAFLLLLPHTLNAAFAHDRLVKLVEGRMRTLDPGTG